MDEYNNTEVIGKEFSEKVESALQLRKKLHNTPMSPSEERMRVVDDYYEAQEKATDYSLKLVASGAYKEEGNPYQLSPELQNKIAPVDAFIDTKVNLLAGRNATPQERARVLDLIDQFSTDRESYRVEFDDGKQERAELIAALQGKEPPKSIDDLAMEYETQLITSTEYRLSVEETKRALQASTVHEEEPTTPEDHAHIGLSKFQELSESLSAFRKALRDKIDNQDIIFAKDERANELESASEQSPTASAGRSDSGETTEPSAKRQRTAVTEISSNDKDLSQPAPDQDLADNAASAVHRSPDRHFDDEYRMQRRDSLSRGT